MSNIKDYADYEHLLSPIMSNLDIILSEAKVVESVMFDVPINNSNNSWKFGTMVYEDEDGCKLIDDNAKLVSNLCPLTFSLCSKIPGVEAFGFSKLKAGGRITPHTHNNRFVSCIINLQSNDDVYLKSGDEISYLKEGEVTIFDYRELHEVNNNGNTDRISLLVLLPIEDKRSRLWVG